MARNILLTATTADKMLEILNGTDFEQANKLHRLGKEINCKVEPRTDFFFEAIPQAGYTPDYEHGFFFEYYPDGVDGNYELWTSVVKADV